MPFGGGLPGNNPRVPSSQGRSYGGDGYGQGYGGYPGQGDGRMPPSGGPRSPDMARYGEKGQQGGARRVPLRVEKVTDKSLQSRLIYGNL